MPDVTVQEHKWVGAAYVTLDSRGQASHADRRGSIRVKAEQRIEVLEVYCNTCKQPFRTAAQHPCFVEGHLRGGPVGERKKRKGEDGS